jgi:light-regulated signal transduction histidine kinase (bacteriophytochrome)
VEAALRNLDAVREEADAIVEIGDLPSIFGERQQLVQLYQNLIGNAIKFRSPERRCHVTLGSRQETGGWLFWVTDNSIGIDPKRADQIFDMFRRLNARSEYPGTGIGLAICRRIVERMSGQIWVESEPGMGSTFWWTLPGRPRIQ